MANYVYGISRLSQAITSFDPKKIESVNLQAEVVNNELEMINQLKDKI
jgi:hypothetical protein